MTRWTLRELPPRVLEILASDRGWWTPTEVARVLDAGHAIGWLRVALVLERLANGGELEIRNPRSRGHRYFRLRSPEASS